MIDKSPSKVIMLVPCFNEGTRLNLKFWQEIVNEIECEWLFINDGSTDDTLEKLESIIRIKVLSFEMKLITKFKAITNNDLLLTFAIK